VGPNAVDFAGKEVTSSTRSQQNFLGVMARPVRLGSGIDLQQVRVKQPESPRRRVGLKTQKNSVGKKKAGNWGVVGLEGTKGACLAEAKKKESCADRAGVAPAKLPGTPRTNGQAARPPARGGKKRKTLGHEGLNKGATENETDQRRNSHRKGGR